MENWNIQASQKIDRFYVSNTIYMLNRMVCQGIQKP